jgi:protein CpxP
VLGYPAALAIDSSAAVTQHSADGIWHIKNNQFKENRMKVLRISATAIALGAVMLSQTAVAQNPGGGGQRGNPPAGQNPGGGGQMGPGGQGGRRPDPAQRVERLASQLNLTEEQKTKAKAIFENEQKQMGELRGNAEMTPEQKKAKSDEIRNTTNTDLRATLTADQQKKFDEMQQKMKERMNGDKSKEGGAKDAPPPPPPGQ